MRILKQEVYFPIIIGLHFILWAIALYLYKGDFMEVSSDTLLFGELTDVSWKNVHRILGEVFSSWVVTVFAFNFLMATRAKIVERIFGGLDKLYLIHRRSGVIAVVLLIAHFITVPRDLVEFNPGKPIGFYALILILLGVIISAAPPLKKKIPYHKWLNIHKLMGLFYVMGVVHGLMVKSLIKELPLIRTYVFGMAFIGIAAWVYRAFLFRLFNKKLEYSISSVSDLGQGLTEVKMAPVNGSMKHLAGQFAFFNFPTVSKKEQHPFTISNAANSNELRVTIKALGDHTNKLNAELKVGESVFVEGPYGHFTEEYVKEQEQVWIAGGIGITPFLALARETGDKNVKLIWCVGKEEEAVYRKELEEVAANNANFEFSIWSSSDLGHLTAVQLGVENYSNKAYLVCGPAAMKSNLISQLREKGVKRSHIHDEEFAFR